MIYLYLKESPLGLKYLGKTEKNPFKYNGSGLYWKSHLKKYNIKSKDIKTTILFETDDVKLKISEKLKGHKLSEETKRKISETLKLKKLQKI